MILNVSFTDDKIGYYTIDEWKKDFKNPQGTNSSGIPEKRLLIVGCGPAKSLKVTYVKDKIQTASGSVFYVPFDDIEEATLEYQFMFEKKFEFNKGGKLPGLAGGNRPTGGKDSSHGFSARLMWYSNGTKGSVEDTSKADLFMYLYYPDKTETYGENIPLNYRIDSGKWYSVKMNIKMNTINKDNGILKVYINNNLVLDKNIVWRKEQYGISAFLFHTFFGGSTDEWKVPKTESSYFDNILIY